MAITGIVSSSELTTKTLRAQDYLINPDRLAENLVACWLKDEDLGSMLKLRSPQLNHLRASIATAVRIAYERGCRNG